MKIKIEIRKNKNLMRIKKIKLKNKFDIHHSGNIKIVNNKHIYNFELIYVNELEYNIFVFFLNQNQN